MGSVWEGTHTPLGTQVADYQATITNLQVAGPLRGHPEARLRERVRSCHAVGA